MNKKKEWGVLKTLGIGFASLVVFYITAYMAVGITEISAQFGVFGIIGWYIALSYLFGLGIRKLRGE